MNKGNGAQNELANARARAASNGLIIRPEQAEQNRLMAEVQKAQATLNELSQTQDAERSLFGNMLSATLSRREMSEAEIGGLRDFARRLNADFQKEKWEQVAGVLTAIGVAALGEQQSHMVWAAKQHGVELVPPAKNPTTADPFVKD